MQLASAMNKALRAISEAEKQSGIKIEVVHVGGLGNIPLVHVKYSCDIYFSDVMCHICYG